jgi:hypothetical protein
VELIRAFAVAPPLGADTLGPFPRQKVMRTPAKPPTGAAGLYARGLVAFGACAKNTPVVGENVPKV